MGRAIVSPRLRREPFAADHERARELAAERVDSAIEPDDAHWLNDHLAWCGPCRAVAAEYDEQRLSLRALRFEQPVPPRDLWARTAAKIEAEPRRHRVAPRGRRIGVVGYASLVGALVVITVAGGALLDRVLPPLGSGTKGVDAEATPIDLVAGEIQVLSHGDDGSLELESRTINQLCPIAANSCGLPTTADVTSLGDIGSQGQLDAIVSPDRGQVVVVERGSKSSAVYVLPLKHQVATATPEETPDATPKPTRGTAAASSGPETSGQPVESSAPATTPAESAPASDGPESTDAPSGPSESPAVTPDESAGPDASDASSTPAESATPEATEPPATEAPTPKTTEPPSSSATEAPPSVEVTPRPDGAVEIASDVVIVGSAAGYSPDGTRFAFSARPADDSSGPDVYVWRVGDRRAKAVTGDHDAQLAGWIGGRLLVSRVVDGKPRTAILDLADDTERAAGDGAMWRPTVGPARETAAWWDGTVRLAEDGQTWVPDRGKLVLGDWPNGGEDTQVLADGSVTDWDVQWSDSGDELAVWVTRDDAAKLGKLSLFTVDPTTGRVDLAHPKLDAESAFAGFALKPGRLAWSAPADGGDTSVEVLGWDGELSGRVSLPATEGAAILH